MLIRFSACPHLLVIQVDDDTFVNGHKFRSMINTAWRQHGALEHRTDSEPTAKESKHPPSQ
eukprot:1035648-Amphidinium_carterae.1